MPIHLPDGDVTRLRTLRMLTALCAPPADEEIAAMPEVHHTFVRIARDTMLARTGAVVPLAELKRSTFFRQDLPKGAEQMNEHLLQKPRNAKREQAAATVSHLVGSALRALQRDSGPFGSQLPAATPRRTSPARPALLF